MSISTATNVSLQTTIGRIAVLTKLSQANTTTMMSNLWLNGSSSVFTDETPATILDELTGKKTSLQLNLRDAGIARDWIAEQVKEVEPTLTQELLDHADLISRNIVKRSPAEFMALKDAWECNVISLNAGHVAMERAFAVYPQLFPGKQITFLANDLMNQDATSRPEINISFDDRFKFLVNQARDKRILKERFSLTETLVERSVAAGLLSTNPFDAMQRYQKKRTWLKVELGATFVLVAGLVAGGFVSHAMNEGTLSTLLWILAFDPGLGFSAVSGDRYIANEHTDLFSK